MQACGLNRDVGLQDETYFDALVQMFEQALKLVGAKPAAHRESLLSRLDVVAHASHDFGYGIGDHMDVLLGRLDGDDWQGTAEQAGS